MNENEQKEQPTHVGVSVSYMGTKAWHQVTPLVSCGVEKKIRFIVSPRSTSNLGVTEALAYLVECYKGWRIANSTAYFNSLDGELISHTEFRPIYLDLESVRKL